jgi:hypothetical protein
MAALQATGQAPQATGQAVTEPPVPVASRLLCLPVVRCDTCGDELIAVFAVARCVACLPRAALRIKQQRAIELTWREAGGA